MGINPNNYPTGFNLPAQFPNDFKVFFKTFAEMIDLGIDSNKAFTYYRGMLSFCLEDNQLYIWEPKNARKAQSEGVMPIGFTYPSNTPNAFGIEYANIEYNFFSYRYNVTGYVNFLYGTLKQNGTQPPVLSVKSLDIPLDLQIALTYEGVGEFQITHPLFTQPNDLHIEMPAVSNNSEKLEFVKTSIAEDGTIRISTVDDANVLQNDILFDHPISIYYFGSNVV